MLNVVTWTFDPILLEFGSLRVGWYGILFAVGLIGIGYSILNRIWRAEGLPEEWLTSLAYIVIIATVVGARLGHCLFYEPAYYLAHPIEILKVWQGGLASHGGTLAIIIAVYYYSKRVVHRGALWTFDRLAVPTGIVAGMIRLGNLANHEIYGHPTDLPWGFRFIQNIPEWRLGVAPPVFSLPSHPTQIYEALCYFLTFAVCMWLYWKRGMQRREGFIFGVFMIMVFTSRFFIEYVKNDQSAFEASMTLNMGQLLSLPFILLGIFSIIYSREHPSPTTTNSSLRKKQTK